MIRNSTAGTMNFSQYFRHKMVASHSDRAKTRGPLLPVFIVLFACVTAVLAWLQLAPQIQRPVDSDMHWKGIEEQLVSERIVGRNDKHWNAAFTLFADDEKVLVTLNVKLIQHDGVTTPALDKRKQVWLQGIDDAWNDRFYLQISDQRLIPIVLAVNFKSVNAHHEVLVRKGSSNPNQHNWYMNTGATAVSHEIGHMLGAYDEYRNGATSPLPVTFNGVSLMGKLAGDGMPRVRHLHLLHQKLVEITGLQSLVIVQPGAE